MRRLLFLLALPLIAIAVDRVVVVEVATATWCPPCARSARGLSDLAERYPGRVLIVEYHSSDDFSNPSSRARNSYYEVGSIPTVIFDGVEKVVGSGRTNMFNTYNTKCLLRTARQPGLEISLEMTENPPLTSLSGELEATIINASDHKIAGKAHFTLTESGIDYAWQTEESLHFVERAMLPYATGEPVELEPGEEIVLTRAFEIDEDWPHFSSHDNVEFGCFVQGADREIYQGAVLKYGESTETEDEARAEGLPGDIEDAVDVSEATEDEGSDEGPRFSLTVPKLIDDSAELTLEVLRSVTITLYMYDQAGTEVKAPYQTARLAPGSYSLTINTEQYADGTYIIKATDGVTTVQKAFRVEH